MVLWSVSANCIIFAPLSGRVFRTFLQQEMKILESIQIIVFVEHCCFDKARIFY